MGEKTRKTKMLFTEASFVSFYNILTAAYFLVSENKKCRYSKITIKVAVTVNLKRNVQCVTIT